MDKDKVKAFIRAKFPHLVTLWRGDTVKKTERQRLQLRDAIRNYYQGTNDEEIIKVLSFLGNNEVQMIPYEFTKKYNADDVIIYTDHASGYPYAIVDNNNVFFPKEYSFEQIRASIALALMEQDNNSPHKYLSNTTNIENGDTAVLIGASDGIFCLSIIEKTKKVYLFEPDKKWSIPLMLTLDKYLNKVEIIDKYISDIDDDENVTLDNFFKSKNESVNFIQADIEGFERKLLSGAKIILSQSNKLKISICTYHKDSDFTELSKILIGGGFNVCSSPGYMIMWMQIPCKAPYLRKGVIYASKYLK